MKWKLAKMMKMGLFSLFTKVKKLPIVSNIRDVPVFDEKYKVVIDFPSSHRDIEKMSWINDNASKRSVDIRFLPGTVYVAFEDESDALFFKIKYL